MGKRFLRYIRSELPYNQAWVDGGRTFSPKLVLRVIKDLGVEQPDLHKVLWYYMFTRHSQETVGRLLELNPRTIRAKLAQASQILLLKLQMIEEDNSKESVEKDVQDVVKRVSSGEKEDYPLI